MGAGPPSVTSRVSKATGRASPPSATSSRPRRGSGLGVLTLYAFSVENWKRPRAEVSTLMGLLKRYLRMELGTLIDNNIRFRVIGRGGGARAGRARGALGRGVERTATNTGMQFNIALNYGGRAEIVDAVRRAIAAGIAPGESSTSGASRNSCTPRASPIPIS